MKRLLPVILLSMFTVSHSAYAKSPIFNCNTVEECQEVISQAEARLQGLSAGGSQRTSNTGAVFIRDASNPALGEAYKDPSGLIWGSIVRAHGKVNPMNQLHAEKYCTYAGARLPTMDEFEQLAKYLGKGTALGYSPYLADGKTDLLPGLSSWSFWSSSRYPTNKFRFFNIDGVNGVVEHYDERLFEAVRCVAGP